MIKVGIKDNLRLTKVEKNDKDTLVVTIQEDGGPSESLMDMLASSSTSVSESDQGFIFWPIKVDTRAEDDAAVVTGLIKSFKAFRAQLNHLLEQFITQDKIAWQPFAGLGFTKDSDFVDSLMNSGTREGVIEKIYSNYVDQFITQMVPHVGLTSPLFRMKLVRQSKDKNFSTIPKFPPFIEPMSIPIAQTKLSWSNYELGYRQGDPKGQPSGWSQADSSPAVGDAATASTANPEEAEAVNKLFGGGNS